jgi:hypothetical protein
MAPRGAKLARGQIQRTVRVTPWNPAAVFASVGAALRTFHQPIGDVFQRDFENRAPFVIDDDLSSPERPRGQSILACDFSASPNRLPCGFRNISEFNTVSVQDGHLSAFEMEEIAGHLCSKIRSAHGRDLASPTINGSRFAYD